MKKWLYTILFLFVSANSYGPIANLSDIEKENSNIRILLNDIFTADTLNTIDYPVVLPIHFEDNIRITSEFGMRYDPFNGLLKRHTGIDIASNKEATIISTAKGVIDKVIYGKYGYGNYILISHANNSKTRYAHLSEIYVKEGELVDFFHPIGLIGKTGRATGIHLHYEVLIGLKPIDPTSFFNINTPEEYISTLRLMEKYVRSNNIFLKV